MVDQTIYAHFPFPRARYSTYVWDAYLCAKIFVESNLQTIRVL